MSNLDHFKVPGFSRHQVLGLSTLVAEKVEEKNKDTKDFVESRLSEVSSDIRALDSRLNELVQLVKQFTESTLRVGASEAKSFHTPDRPQGSNVYNDVHINSNGSGSGPFIALPHQMVVEHMGTSTPPTIPKGGSNRPTQSNATQQEHPSAPVDSNQKFPTKVAELPLTNVHPEEYTRWSIKMMAEVKGLTKFEGIIDKPPEESLRIFQARNRKYSPESLEQHYLDAHKAAWSYLSKAIDTTLSVEFSELIQEEAKHDNLTRRLKFVNADDSFYENANALWNKIRDKYMTKTIYRLESIFSEWHAMKYNGTEDPKAFISRYQQLHARGKLLVPNYIEIHDSARAVDILSRLPKTAEFNNLKNSFYRQDESARVISVNEVEQVLSQWWIDQKDTSSQRISDDKIIGPVGQERTAEVMAAYRGRYYQKRNHQEKRDIPSHTRTTSTDSTDEFTQENEDNKVKVYHV